MSMATSVAKFEILHRLMSDRLNEKWKVSVKRGHIRIYQVQEFRFFTCSLSYVTLCIAAVSTVCSLLGSPQNGQAEIKTHFKNIYSASVTMGLFEKSWKYSVVHLQSFPSSHLVFFTPAPTTDVSMLSLLHHGIHSFRPHAKHIKLQFRHCFLFTHTRPTWLLLP